MLIAAPPPPPPPPPAAPVLAAPSRAGGAFVAHVTAPAVARSRPAATAPVVWVMPAQTAWAHQPQDLLVLASTERWLQVRLPLRRNRAAAWIARDAATITRTTYWVRLRTATRRISVLRGGRSVRELRAVVGRAATPTPTGLAAVYERVAQPNPRGFYGPWALHLTALSPVLFDFGGGPGRIAIHGRAGTSLRDPLGSARSHGCIRISNPDVRWLASHLVAGTPVEITRY